MTKEENKDGIAIVDSKVVEDSASNSNEKNDVKNSASTATAKVEVGALEESNSSEVGAASDKGNENEVETDEQGSKALSFVKAEGNDKPDTAMTEAGSTKTDDVTVLAGNADVELTANFPQKLTDILSNEEYKEIVHWLPHGKGFIIADKKRFGDEVLPKYFKKAKFTSFTRKLNRWNFVRITRGPEVGSYFHPNFQRDDPKLVSQMTCIGSKQPQALKPLDPIALGLLPMGEAPDTTKPLGGIQQWQPQDHERYRLFYQQSHWNYMMQMMQQQQQAAATVPTETTKEADINGDAAGSTAETINPVKAEGASDENVATTGTETSKPNAETTNLDDKLTNEASGIIEDVAIKAEML